MSRLDYSNGVVYGLPNVLFLAFGAKVSELVVPYSPRRVLRSAESNLLTVPPGKPGKYGSRSFVKASSNLWNTKGREGCLA